MGLRPISANLFRMFFVQTSTISRKNVIPSEAEGSAVRPTGNGSEPRAPLSPFVIPTGAHPDFLPRCTGRRSVCAFP